MNAEKLRWAAHETKAQAEKLIDDVRARNCGAGGLATAAEALRDYRTFVSEANLAGLTTEPETSDAD